MPGRATVTKTDARIATDKQLMVDQLKKIPIVQVACEKVGVGRSTYYRWLKEDPEFSEQAESAVRDGRWAINEMAESHLLSMINQQNMTAIIFWLKHNHPIYGNRLEISTKQSDDKTPLTEEQRLAISKALELGMIPMEGKDEPEK